MIDLTVRVVSLLFLDQCSYLSSITSGFCRSDSDTPTLRKPQFGDGLWRFPHTKKGSALLMYMLKQPCARFVEFICLHNNNIKYNSIL